MKFPVIFIVGPTASGKSEVAVHLAKKLAGQIISCDSMQVYKGMEIITSQPSAVLRRRVRHHLLGILPPEKEYDAARFRRDAVKKIKEIVSRGSVPVFCGGTGLYMMVLVDGIFQAGPEDKKVRKDLYQKAQKYGKGYLYLQLKRRDPQAAAKIHPNDLRRIVRALEVFKTTGKPISELQRQRKGLAEEYDVRVFCLNPERKLLYQKIDRRLDRMFAQGLIKEVKKLLRLKLSRTSGYAIGIKELKEYMEGNCALVDAKALMARNTRQYAKRQLTWFRKDKRIRWIKVKGKDRPKEIAERIWKKLSL